VKKVSQIDCCISECIDEFVTDVVYPHCQSQCNEGTKTSECVTQCVDDNLLDGAVNDLCTERCSTVKKFKDWIKRVTDTGYWKLYFGGFKLQDKVLALKKAAAVLQQVPAAAFDNVGFFRPNPNAAYSPISFVAQELPSYPGQS
jgi:hypothetical protein